MSLPTVIIGVPTYSGKSYCEDKFFDALLAINYPRNRMLILVIDNSLDNGKYANHLKGKYPELKIIHEANPEHVVYERLANSHEYLRKAALKANTQYLLHLESDVIVPKDIVQKMLLCRKPIVSPIYHISNGSNRHIVQRNRQWGQPFQDKYSWGHVYGHATQAFVDGRVKQVQTSGIGCILIHKSILNDVPFRYRKDVDAAPDSAFATDLLMKGIPNFCDTGTLVEHINSEDWGQGNSLLKEKYEGR